ncbi:LysR family transcriptional regulator [Paraburkholderia flava]|uniref:LysR family transcriptional regulator n=1 Tax=Paraburkholderia flava TaxID=2547393 RepID=UPI00105CCB4E|nr:LysR family transcriptional regulator [Paraburkholderia flava]
MNQLDQLTSMVIFAKIVDTLSYTEAAKLLGLSKSAVSKEINRLETGLGVTLLKRTTRKIEVTEVGRTYYEYCVRLLAEVRGADAFVRQYHEEPVGNLRVVAPTTFGNRMILPTLCRFIASNIHVQVDLELTDRLVDLNEQNVDVAIVISRDKPDQGTVQPLTEVHWGVFASPAYIASHPPVTRPEDLARHGFLLFRGPAYTTALQLRQGKRQLETRVRCILRSNNSVSLLNAAIAGVGVAYLPRYVAREAIATGQLQQLLPDWASETRVAYVMYRDDRFLSPRVRMFVQGLADFFASEASGIDG